MTAGETGFHLYPGFIREICGYGFLAEDAKLAEGMRLAMNWIQAA